MKNTSKEEWKKKLTPEQYAVMFEKGTEPKFTKNWNNTEKGMYTCAACGNPLFSSDAKFELNPSDWNYGWPSFDDPVSKENVELRTDDSYGMHRTEVICRNCGAHLGHLFNDGPKETTGQHYCVNSCALNFKTKEEK